MKSTSEYVLNRRTTLGSHKCIYHLPTSHYKYPGFDVHTWTWLDHICIYLLYTTTILNRNTLHVYESHILIYLHSITNPQDWKSTSKYIWIISWSIFSINRTRPTWYYNSSESRNWWNSNLIQFLTVYKHLRSSLVFYWEFGA